MSNVSREDVRRWVREEILAIAEGLAAMQKAEARQVVATVQTETLLPDDLLAYVTVEGNTVRTRKFISEEGVWERINKFLKQKGYAWIKEGKDSRWQR